METTDRSEAQINANRENARKSTGPRTTAGKAASSRNSLTHGLTAKKHLIRDEDSEEFLVLLKDHFDTFRPVGPSEENLVLRIANAQWRLDRAFPMEAGIYRESIRKVAEHDATLQRIHGKKKAPIPGDDDLLARAFIADCEGPHSLTNLARYETAIERSIDRCLRQLKAYQAARNSPQPDPEPAPKPATAPSNSTDYETKPRSDDTAPQPAPQDQIPHAHALFLAALAVSWRLCVKLPAARSAKLKLTL